MDTALKVFVLLIFSGFAAGGIWVWSSFVFECFQEKAKVSLVLNFLVLMFFVVASVATLCVMAWQMFAS